MATTSALPSLPSLSPEQQALLLAALESNRRNRETNASMNTTRSTTKPSLRSNTSSSQTQSQSPQPINPSRVTPASAKSGSATFGDGLLGDFFESSPSFDVDFPLSNGDYFNSSYSSYPQDDSSSGDAVDNADGADATGSGEKRKSPDDDEDDEDEMESGKRQEGDDKSAKKPGRKLITTEPTTKRKAQNRAAQRAFRERKEKHVKDLELKVADLEKMSETKSSENTVLRAQIERLQTELKEYKKRLSSANTTLSSSPKNRPSPGFGNHPLKGLLADFQFDFDKFGGGGNSNSTNSPNMPLFGSSSFQPSQSASDPPRSHSLASNGYNSQLTMDALDSQFNKQDGTLQFSPTLYNGLGNADYSKTSFASPPTLNHNASNSSSSRHQSQSNQSRSESNADSPCSSTGLTMGTSSCGTSPEPVPNYNADGLKSFGDLSYDSNFSFSNQFTNMAPPSQALYDFSGVDWLSNQNGGQFDPQLFGDYRESQAAVVGDDAFNSGLFDEPYSFNDLNNTTFDPTNFGLGDMNQTTTTVSPLDTTKQPSATTKPTVVKPAANLMEQMDRCCNGETAKEPASLTTPPPATTECPNKFVPSDTARYMTTQKLWHELQTCPKFLSGDLDIDTLCSELSAKATCSETGMQVPKDVVEQVLWRLAGVPEDADQSVAEQIKVQQRNTAARLGA